VRVAYTAPLVSALPEAARAVLPAAPNTLSFEKWQALGNDYLILEAAQLPFELTATRIRRLCDPHVGIGSDGVLLLAAPDDPRSVARLSIFNPDGSEAELSGNGAREAILYLRRAGWTNEAEFSIETKASVIRARVIDDQVCAVDMGNASTASVDFPGAPSHGQGTLQAGGQRWRFQHVSIGNPQCAIHMSDRDELEQLNLQAVGPTIERHEQFPNRTNVSWYTEVASCAIRARIFERGVGETMSSGTGAIGAAVAHVLRGGDSPVTVHLDGGDLVVTVGDDLRIGCRGWAVPVFRGELAADFLSELTSA